MDIGLCCLRLKRKESFALAGIDVLRKTSNNVTMSNSREHPIEIAIIGFVVVPPELIMLVANDAANVNDSGSGPR